MLKKIFFPIIDPLLIGKFATCNQIIFTRFINYSPPLSSGPGKPRLVKMCELNKTLYIHRNAEFGPQPIFYRGPKKIDLYQRYLDKQEKFKQWTTFSRQVEVGETPEDDVYLTSLFKTKERKLKEAISTLKEYTLLDLTDQKSLIKLKFNLVEITKGKGKRKKPVTFFDAERLPHPCGHRNKVCLFSSDEAIIEEALELGVHVAGSHDIVTKILSGSLKCDAYFTTPDYIKELLSHSDLKMALKGHLPNKNFHVIDDVIELSPYVTDTIVQNVLAPKACEVNIGEVGQSVDELLDNALAIVQFIHAKAEASKLERIIESGSLSCFTEPLLLDYSDLLPDEE